MRIRQVFLSHRFWLSCLLRRLEDTTDWLLTDNVTSWSGTLSDRAWRYLRQSLERHDGPDTDMRYSKVVFETITGLERASTPPPWLIQKLEVSVFFLWSAISSSTKPPCDCKKK